MQPVVCLVLAYLAIWLSCFDAGKPCLLITEELVVLGWEGELGGGGVGSDSSEKHITSPLRKCERGRERG